jgi:tripartite-type tricarboxylate transporter receptor subunit TctC
MHAFTQFFAGAAVAAMMGWSTGGLAQDWPVKPVRFIVATSVGLSSDIVGRIIADRLSKKLGQSFFIENMPGAGGALGYQAAARAPGDGYTVLMGSSGGLVLNSFIFKKLSYEPMKDYVPIAMVVNTGGFVVTATESLPVKSIAELIALEKSKRGSISYGFESSAAQSDVIGQMLNKKAGLDMVGIPYKSSAQAINDTVVGRTQLFISSLAAVHVAAESGKLRRIAIVSKRRLPTLPNVPTLHETWPGFAFSAYLMMVAPAATPAPIAQRFNKAMQEVLAEPDVIKRMAALNFVVEGAGTPESLKEVLIAEYAEAAKIFKDLGYQPQE